MILTVTPNPALDKTAVIPGFTLGSIHRPAEVSTLAGGKGVNFARALRTLGIASQIVGLAGGHTGQLLRDLAEQEGLSFEAITVAGELRTCLTIVDASAGNRLTEIYEPGAPLEAGAWERLITCVGNHLTRATHVAVCGSFPPAMPEHGLRNLTEVVHSAGVPLLLDVSGSQLANTLPLGPSLVKINQHEASEVTRQAITSPTEAVAAARELCRLGARAAIITLGNLGAVGVNSEGEAFGWATPEVLAISAVGSGDSLFAGVAAGLARGQSLAEALRWGVAVGAANTVRVGAGRFERDDAQRLLTEMRALPIDHCGGALLEQ